MMSLGTGLTVAEDMVDIVSIWEIKWRLWLIKHIGCKKNNHKKLANYSKRDNRYQKIKKMANYSKLDYRGQKLVSDTNAK